VETGPFTRLGILFTGRYQFYGPDAGETTEPSCKAYTRREANCFIAGLVAAMQHEAARL
jgi:hypothetical protein